MRPLYHMMIGTFRRLMGEVGTARRGEWVTHPVLTPNVTAIGLHRGSPV